MATKNFTISAVIKAVDKITAPVTAIGRKLQSITSRFSSFGAGMRKFSDTSGLTKVGQALSMVAVRAERAGQKIAAIAGPLVAIGAAAVTAGLYSITKGFSDSGDEAATTATKLGVATDELQRMRYAAAMLDVEQGTLDGGLKKLSRSITVASKGAKDQTRALRMLGYTDKQIASGKIKVGDATTRLAKRMEDEKKAKSNAIIANALYGKSYLEMMPLLKAGSAQIQALRLEAERLGLVFDTKTAEEFDDAQKKLNFSLMGLRNTIGAQLLPVLTPMIAQLTEFIVANRQEIGSKLAEALTQIALAMKGIDWGAVMNGILMLVKGIAWVAKNIEWLIGLWAALKLASTAQAVLSLATAFARLGIAIGTFLIANPIVAVIAVVIGVLWALYENWDSIVGLIKKLWESLGEAAARVGGIIKDAFNDAWEWVKQGAQSVYDFIAGIFDKIVEKIQWAVNGIKGLAADLKALATDNAITRGFSNIVNGASSATNAPAGSYTYTGRGASALRPQASAPAANGKAQVEVTFKNTPPGTRVNSEVKGNGLNLGTDVGYQAAGAF